MAFGGFLLGPAVLLATNDGESPALHNAEEYLDRLGNPAESGELSGEDQVRADMELEASVLDTLTDGEHQRSRLCENHFLLICS